MSTASIPAGPAAPPRRTPWFRRRWLVALAILVALPCSMAGLGLICLGTVALRAEREAIAEADRADPGWRLADIEAARAVVPDAENAALVVLRAASLMGPGGPYAGLHLGASADNWPFRRHLLTYNLDPTAALAPSTAAAYADDLAPFDAARAAARGLAGMRRGRYPSVPRGKFLRSRPPHLDILRDVARLLDAEATLAAERGDGDAAILACRAILGASASLGDEPGLPAAQSRMETIEAAMHALERALGQGTAGDASLAALDADLAAADAVPSLRVALRGERAETDARLEAQVATLPRRFAVYAPLARVWIRYGRASALSRATEAVAIADLPGPEQIPRWDARTDTPATARGLWAIFLDSPASQFALPPWNMAEAFLSTNARLRAARVAVALERFRLAHGRWPADAVELALPGGLPRDPLAAAPLKMVREPRGWALYSVGANGLDQGGKFSQSKFPTVDVGLRIHDPGRRRRAAP